MTQETFRHVSLNIILYYSNENYLQSSFIEKIEYSLEFLT